MDHIVPLFAHNRRLWLRLWAVTQAAAMIVGTGAAGLSPRSLAVLTSLVAYHALGFVFHEWMLRRSWAVLLYVPAGWALVSAAISVHPSFALLAFGVAIQTFIFLPFAWAALALGAGLLLFLIPVVADWRQAMPRVLLTQIGALVAVSITTGTILLYVHTANREAAVRADLLRRLGVLAERERLSRDIHDTLAQAFVSVVRHLEAIELELVHMDAPAAHGLRASLAQAQSVSRESLAEIRGVVRALRPTELTETTLPSAIERIVTRWSGANHIRADIAVTGVPPLSPDADVIFLRAAQESLSNVARHASARHVRVTLGRVDELVLLTVEDDGKGFDQTDEQSTEHLGLSGMRERVRQFGGHVLIESAPGAGTSVTVAMPVTAIAGSTT